WNPTTPSSTGSRATALPRCGCSSGCRPSRWAPSSSDRPAAPIHTGGVGPPPEGARAALDQREWGLAYRLLSEQAGPLAPEELDWLGEAAYLTGRDQEAFDAWAAAHRAGVDGGRPRAAARSGLKIANALFFKGDVARGSGWVARIGEILA